MEADKGREACHQALQNSVILDNIFRLLELKDLKTARLVCSSWNDIASPFVQDKGFVKLYGDEVTLINAHRESKRVTHFIQQFQNVAPEKILFRNYKLNSWIINDRNQQGIRFWEKFGVKMKSVELSSFKVFGIDNLRNLLFYWTPSLNRLYLRNCSFYDVPDKAKSYQILKKAPYPETKYDIPVNKTMISLGIFGAESLFGMKYPPLLDQLPPLTWEEIFIGYPNLKQLKLFNLKPKDTCGVLDALAEMNMNVPGSVNIAKLNISYRCISAQAIAANNLPLFSKLHIPLKNLHMDNRHSSKSCFAFLTVYAQNLKKLEIGPYLDEPLKNFLLNFPNLTILKMTNTRLDNFNFLERLPNLKELALDFKCCQIFPTVRFTSAAVNGPFVNLTNLSINYGFPGREDVDRIVKWFPNVKKLRMHLDNVSFQTICKHLTKLIDFEVLGGRVTVDGMLGFNGYSMDEVGVIRENRIPCYFIHLTELRRFRIMYNNGRWNTLKEIISLIEGPYCRDILTRHARYLHLAKLKQMYKKMHVMEEYYTQFTQAGSSNYPSYLHTHTTNVFQSFPIFQLTFHTNV